jgi:hypothetical protein
MVSASASCQETVPRASIRPAGFETARLELWAQALSGINQRQTLILVRMSTLEHYDFIEKIAFARKRLSDCSDKQATIVPRSSQPHLCELREASSNDRSCGAPRTVNVRARRSFPCLHFCNGESEMSAVLCQFFPALYGGTFGGMTSVRRHQGRRLVYRSNCVWIWGPTGNDRGHSFVRLHRPSSAVAWLS